MHAVGRADPGAGGIQDAFAEHVACAVEAFLARLEHEDDVAAELVPLLGQEGGGSGEHGGVQVVAAGVHCPIGPGGEVHSGLFLDGQSVHVRAEEDGRALAAVCFCLLVPTARVFAAQDCRDRRRLLAQRDLVRQPIQRLKDLLLGAREVEPDFRLAVKVVAKADQVFLQVLGVVSHGHG